MKPVIALLFVAVCLLSATIALGQDATKVDPKHYKVESENDHMRIVRVHYGPHEKSVMHSHPNGAAIYLTDGNIKFHMPDGKTQDNTGKAGQAILTPAMVHNPENTSDKPFDAVLIELKGAAGSEKPKTAKAEKK
jgi:quercetin dioxygenase-like cupin family protein